MKHLASPLVLCLGVAALVGPAARAQEDPTLRVIEPGQVRAKSDHTARESLGRVQASLGQAGLGASRAAANLVTLPTWSYSVTAAQNGQQYTGQIVGANPFNPGGATTNIPATLIPVILRITQNGRTYVFDPTAPDPGCLGSGNTGLSLTQQSPVFSNASFTLNNVNVGNTQYGDAFLRGEFWNAVSGNSNYHLLLQTTTGSPLTISVNAGRTGNQTAEVFALGGSQCGYNRSTNPAAKLGLININTIDGYLQSYITANGLSPSQFPFFILYNAAIANGPANNLNNCCILGYHNALGNPGQTYGIAEFEGRDQTVFSGVSDVSTATHEVGEWIDDPMGSNPTPSWGKVGQVSGCQANLEVGDPLSGALLQPVTMPNGFTYHLQELAYFSWFYGGASLGTGGKYSDNGTFSGAATVCN